MTKDTGDIIVDDSAELDELEALLSDDAPSVEATPEESAEAIEAAKDGGKKKGGKKRKKAAAPEAAAEVENPCAEVENPCAEVAADENPEAEADAPDAKAPKAPRPTFDLSSEALFHKIGEAELALITSDEGRKQTEIRKEIATSIDAAAKKVQEKAVNMLTVAATGGKLSRYTEIALKSLLDVGVVTSATLVKGYTDVGLKEGTARSQAGQMMQLFPMMKLAVRADKKLTVNADSVLAEAFRA